MAQDSDDWLRRAANGVPQEATPKIAGPTRVDDRIAAGNSGEGVEQVHARNCLWNAPQFRVAQEQRTHPIESNTLAGARNNQHMTSVTSVMKTCQGGLRTDRILLNKGCVRCILELFV